MRERMREPSRRGRFSRVEENVRQTHTHRALDRQRESCKLTSWTGYFPAALLSLLCPWPPPLAAVSRWPSSRPAARQTSAPWPAADLRTAWPGSAAAAATESPCTWRPATHKGKNRIKYSLVSILSLSVAEGVKVYVFVRMCKCLVEHSWKCLVLYLV